MSDLEVIQAVIETELRSYSRHEEGWPVDTLYTILRQIRDNLPAFQIAPDILADMENGGYLKPKAPCVSAQ